MKQARYAILTFSLFLLPIAAYSQGFGMFGKPKIVTVKRLLPAAVNLNQKRIRVEATSPLANATELSAILKTKLVTMIQRDPRFIVDEKNPETILHFVVTNWYVDQKHITTGTGANTQNCIVYIGKLETSYQALEAKTNAPFDSENLSFALTMEDKAPKRTGGVFSKIPIPGAGGNNNTCGTGGKTSVHEAQDELVDQIVHQMAQRAAPTEEPLEIPLPGGKLEPLSSLAMSQRWGTLEEEATKMEKFAKPADDAYRVYLIALAKETQAYDLAREAQEREQGKRPHVTAQQADTEFQRAQTYLDDARKLYKDAIQDKPGEKEFRTPDDRMEKAVLVYATIARHKKEYEEIVKSKPPAPSAQTSKLVAPAPAPSVPEAKATPQTPPPPPATAAKTSPLDQVVTDCKAGMDLASISEYIKDPAFQEDAKATSYKFDIRKDPVTLAESCKDKAGPIQKLIREQLTPKPGSAPKVAAAPSSAQKK